MSHASRTGWRPNFLQRKHISKRPAVRRDPERKRKITREDARRFWYNETKNPKAKATKRSHGTKKIESRTRNRRAKAARKVNR